MTLDMDVAWPLRSGLSLVGGVVGPGGGGGLAPFPVNAVRFDGTNDALDKSTNLTGVADGDKGTFVAWMRFHGGDGTQRQILQNRNINGNIPISIRRLSNNKLQIIGTTAAPATTLDILSSAELKTAAEYTCVMASWRNGTGAQQRLYFGDVSVRTGGSHLSTINYDQILPEWQIGANFRGLTNLLSADVAMLYFNPVEFVDFDLLANRRRVIRPNGKPEDMGVNGELLTGTAPLVFHDGPTDTWHVNKGTGGGFAEVGALTDAPTSPSD